MTELTPELQKKLREPFPSEVIGKLPRVSCGLCRQAAQERRNGGVCNNHRKARCRTCGNYVSEAHIHLDYVGHAEVTDRLLAVDPSWDWEPVAFSPDGLPAFDKLGGLWIRLTIAGQSRLGYGHADGKTGPDAVKEAIGDAIRNAAMRFGVALDLWGASYKDAGPDEPDEQPQTHIRPTSVPTPAPAPGVKVASYDELIRLVVAAGHKDALRAAWEAMAESHRNSGISDQERAVVQAAIDEKLANLEDADAERRLEAVAA